MTAPDQTNAEVSDERMREIEPCPFCGKELEFSENLSIHGGGWMHHGDEAERDRPCFLIGKIIYNNPGDLERWNRRSVTSQAREGEVVAWTIAQDPSNWNLTPTPPVVAWMADEHDGRHTVCIAGAEKPSGYVNYRPLYASPVSKRVERLETALRMLVRRSRTVIGGLAPGQSLEPAGANHTNMFIAAIEEADALLDQALPSLSGEGRP